MIANIICWNNIHLRQLLHTSAAKAPRDIIKNFWKRCKKFKATVHVSRIKWNSDRILTTWWRAGWSIDRNDKWRKKKKEKQYFLLILAPTKNVKIVFLPMFMPSVHISPYWCFWLMQSTRWIQRVETARNWVLKWRFAPYFAQGTESLSCNTPGCIFVSRLAYHNE